METITYYFIAFGTSHLIASDVLQANNFDAIRLLGDETLYGPYKRIEEAQEALYEYVEAYRSRQFI